MVCRAGYENDPIEKMRHSCAHVLADAVTRLFPTAKPTIGPVIENGFYYDFDYAPGFKDEDLVLIEAEMHRILETPVNFIKEEISRDEAIAYFKKRGEVYKIEIVENLPANETLTFYKHGDFVDLCKGPHIENTKEIGAFKLTTVAGAYWRGDAKNAMLQRIYGVAFKTTKELEDYLLQVEEAKKRDHRKLGKELGIFTFDDDVGQGLPLWLPNGAALCEVLEDLGKKVEARAGYQRVRTPNICKENLYLTSGHLPYYADSMYPAMEIDGTRYYLKPMNCPHHHKIYGASPKSYRDLPVRFAEYGTCHRYEQSGELFGLMRVRSMQMNDAHIYCTLEQFENEFLAVCQMYADYFKLFGIERYQMRLSLHDSQELGKKYVNEPEMWIKTEEMVRQAMIKSGVPFVEIKNEAAFYGPKIDVQIWSAIGREFTLATNQIDFAVPKRFGLTYKNAENKDETPLCIHRSPLSTHERLIGFLLEHYAGDFPFWLAPVQAKVITINSAQEDYAREVKAKLVARGVRVELDLRSEKLGLKIREAQMSKVPYMLVIGKNEALEGKVSVRSRTAGDLGAITLDELLERFKQDECALLAQN